MNLETLTEALIHDEGKRINARGRHVPYKCPADRLTIGYGRNIEDNGLTENEARTLLQNDAIQACRDAAALIPNWLTLDDVRQNVLANMAFQLGKPKLSKFVKFLAAVNEARFDDAAAEMTASAWYGQSGIRSMRLVKEMKTGKI